MSTFQDKVIIVTGCSNGIGLATTLLFLDRKAQVFGIDVAPFAHTLTDAQREDFTFHQVDLAQTTACNDAVTECRKQLRRVDVLVNCAGISDGWSSADTLQDSEWERVMTINLTVPVRMMSAVLPIMKEQKAGAIVNVGSKASVSGATAGIAYTASKHGLAGAMKNVAWRFRHDNIRCNGVLPGGVATNIASSVQMDCFDPAGFAQFFPIVQMHVSKDADGNPIPVVGAADIARGIAFLASDEARIISGAMIPIDNAWSTI